MTRLVPTPASGTTSDELARRIVAGDPAAALALVEHAPVGEIAFWRHPEQLEALSRHLGGAPGPLRFSPATSTAVPARIVGAPAPGGILALGPVELPLASSLGLERVRIDANATTLLRRPR